MNTIELTIPVDEARHEVLIARLEEFGFNGFRQDAGALRAYISSEDWSRGKAQYVASWLQKQGARGAVQERVIEDQNWNALWEETLQPMRVGPFWIKPTWAEAPAAAEGAIVLDIDPKMSFGTGYHESTRLMLRFLPDLVADGDVVLDAGTGTGVLAIAAVHLGAEQVIAFDVSEWSDVNARENCDQNGVAASVDVRHGDIGVVPETGFDTILANIERDILIDLLPHFAEKIAPGGHVALAGLLIEDQPPMRAAIASNGFTIAQDATENEWWAVVLRA